MSRTKLMVVVVVVIAILAIGVFVSATRAPGGSPSSSKSGSANSSSNSTSTSASYSSVVSNSFQNSSADYTLNLANGTLSLGNYVPDGVQNLLGAPTATSLVYDQSNGLLYAFDTSQELLVINATTNRLTSITYLPGVSNATNVTTQIYTGRYVALDPSNGYLYATSFANYVGEGNPYSPTNVTVISTESDAVVANVVIGGNTSSTGTAVGIAYDASTQQVFVAMDGAGASATSRGVAYLAVIDAATNAMTGKISLGTSASGLAFDPTNGVLYVSSSTTHSIVGVNPSAQSVSSNMTLSWCTAFCTQLTGPGRLFFDTANDVLYATGYVGGYGNLANISAIDPSTNKAIANFSVPAGGVTSLAFDSSGGVFAIASVGVGNSTIGVRGEVARVFEFDPSNYHILGSAFVGAATISPIAFDPANGFLYCPDGLYSSINVLNTSSLTIEGAIATAFMPTLVTLDQKNDNIYVANELANDIAVVNGSTNEVEAYITVPSVASALDWDSINDDLYVLTNAETVLANSYASEGANGTNDLTVINCSTNSLTDVIPLGPIANPSSIAIDYLNDQISVADLGTSLVYSANATVVGSGLAIINGTSNEVAHVLSLPQSPITISYDPYVSDLFVGFSNLTQIDVVNDTSGSIIGTIALVVGEGATGNSSDPGPASWPPGVLPDVLHDLGDKYPNLPPKDLMYIINECSSPDDHYSNIYSIPNNPQDNFEIEHLIEQDTEECLATGLDLVDWIADSLNQGTGPYPNLVIPTHSVYVLDPSTDSVLSIDDLSNTINGNISVGSYPAAGTWVASTGMLYVLNYGSDTVSVINTNTSEVVGTITAGVLPTVAAYDNETGTLYVTNFASSNVALIDTKTNSVAGFASVGMFPTAEMYDPVNGNLYVCNIGSGTISILRA